MAKLIKILRTKFDQNEKNIRDSCTKEIYDVFKFSLNSKAILILKFKP